MERTPLASACIEALSDPCEPGSGLKLLRLVSKQVNAAMLRSITGYTLTLDGVTEELPDVSLLNLIQLSDLNVEVVAGK